MDYKWKNLNLDGRVSFVVGHSFLYQTMFIEKVILPTERLGKVRKGQKVNIRFSNYPDKEFSIVKGIVENISLIPVVDGQNVKSYVVDIQLPNGLRTSYNKEFSKQVSGICETALITISFAKFVEIIYF